MVVGRSEVVIDISVVRLVICTYEVAVIRGFVTASVTEVFSAVVSAVVLFFDVAVAVD